MDGKNMGNKKGGGGMYTPSGELQGDTKSMPDRGTRTGVTDTYGCDLSQESCGRMGSMGGAAKSDGMEAA
jgi:hypothetical protein